MTGGRRSGARRGAGSSLDIVREGATDAVNSGIVRDADAGTLSVVGGSERRVSSAAAGASRLEASRRRAGRAADAVFGDGQDGDDGSDASADALGMAEETVTRHAYGRIAGGSGTEEDVHAPSSLHQQRQRSIASRANVYTLSAPQDDPTPETRSWEGLRPEGTGKPRSGVAATPDRGAAGGRGRVASEPPGPGRLSRRSGKRATPHELQRRRNMAASIQRHAAVRAEAPAVSAGRYAARRASRKGISAAAASIAAPLAGAAAAVLAIALCTLLASQVTGSLFGFWKHEVEARATIAGLPPYITYEMVLEALECQEEYGHPAGCTLAQIILESGSGDGLSGLAERDNNLFGIKWSSDFADCPEVTGCEAWVTGEEYDGELVTVTDYFTCFVSQAASIRFRSRVLLQASRYAGNALIRQAIDERDSDLMAQGLKDAGYATSSEYVEALVSIMDSYGLRRFDSMAPEDLEAGGSVTGSVDLGADASALQQAVVNAAFAETYHESGYCAEWVMRVYEQCGLGRQYGGDARDIYWAWCTSSDLSTLRPGMVIAVSSTGGYGAGATFGHVGIYVGGGMVRHNTGGAVRMTPVEEWIAWYSSAMTPRWGWYGGIPLY